MFSFNNLTVPHMPDNGMKIRAYIETNHNLGISDRDYFRFGGELNYYQFFGKQVLGFASRIGFEHIDGEFEFYQAVQLGGRTNFRAARSERFLGNTVFYHNIDLRLRGFGVGQNTGNASGGLIAGFDYGRVWLREEESDTWHIGYGGGIWYAPFDLAIINATFFTSPTGGSRVNIGGGFPF
ncbi:MAG: BamA/TamA family outer membrane protein [Bacteroidota bacterium]